MSIALLTFDIYRPYGPVSFTTDDTLTRHTIYAPATGPDTPMSVLVWGNGACSDDGTSAQNFLAQVASYGFVAIASGTPGGSGGSTTVDWMTEAVEWVVGGANGLNVDSSRIFAAGYSCGGTEAYQMQNNDAVSSIGIFNSGLLSDYEFASQLTKPIIFALGGPSDVAHENVSHTCLYDCTHQHFFDMLMTTNRASVTTPHSPPTFHPGRAI
jgi:dienelactone hydrolase